MSTFRLATSEMDSWGSGESKTDLHLHRFHPDRKNKQTKKNCIVLFMDCLKFGTLHWYISIELGYDDMLLLMVTIFISYSTKQFPTNCGKLFIINMAVNKCRTMQAVDWGCN